MAKHPRHESSSDSFMLESNGAVACRRRLYQLVISESLSDDVIVELLPDGQPHEYEKSLWDYKREIPVAPSGVKLSDSEKRSFDAKMSEIVKDAVAFYNSYGGYLVIGVSDNPRIVSGWDKGFNCDDLNKRIKSSTNHDIDCHFATKLIDDGSGVKKICLLLIPQRPDTRNPAQFLIGAKEAENGKKAYNSGDILIRDGHECRKAVSADDFNFLCSQGRRRIVSPREESGLTSILDNNLGARDPGFLKFVGRAKLLSDLWLWLCDRYTPVKLLAGLGGVGKTTLAREFAEDVLKSSPMGFERVIWLSAKKRFYAPTLNEYVLATRVDFFDTKSLLKALLLELGYLESDLDEDWAMAQLIDHVTNALRLTPAFIVVDDVDSLEPVEQQSELFHTMLQIIGQTMSGGRSPSRGLLTARLTLGAAPGQLMRVSGLDLKDFAEYANMAAESMGLPIAILGKKKMMERFHKVTDGSPTFASSILRLVELGTALSSALDKWGGSDGQEVRQFAFQRELYQLADSQVRTLFVLCLLGETSKVELRQITQSSDTLLDDDLSELRKYHLVALEGDIPGSGPRLRVPESIRLMTLLIRSKVNDPKHLENECGRARRGAPQIGVDLGHLVHRIVALWRDNKPNDALEEAEYANKRNPGNGDLKCLLGRAYLRIDQPHLRKADRAFREAHKLGCQRTELVDLWAVTKKKLGDWIGLIDVTRIIDQKLLCTESTYYLAEAYGELASAASKTGSLSVAAEHYLSGARSIATAFSENRAVGRVPELKQMRTHFMGSYVAIVDHLTVDADRHIEIWLAVMEAFRAYVRSSRLIRLGLDRLISWWSAVEQRKKRDRNSANQLHGQLRQIDFVINECKGQEAPDLELVSVCQQVSESLSHRLKEYLDRISALETDSGAA